MDPRVRARRRHGVGRLSLRPRCRWGGRRTSHATDGVGEPLAGEPGRDHLPHDRARTWRGDVSASVSPSLVGGELDRQTGGFTLLSTPDGHVRCRLTEGAASTCFATETSGPFASVVEAPKSILGELGASGGSVVSAAPRRTIAGILPIASARAEIRRRRLAGWSGASRGADSCCISSRGSKVVV